MSKEGWNLENTDISKMGYQMRSDPAYLDSEIFIYQPSCLTLTSSPISASNMQLSSYPPCKVEIKTMTSFSSNAASSWPHSSQSQSFIRTRTPGLTLSPFMNISGLSLIKFERTQDSRSFIVKFFSPAFTSTLTWWIFTDWQRSSRPPLH